MRASFLSVVQASALSRLNASVYGDGVDRIAALGRSRFTCERPEGDVAGKVSNSEPG